MVMDALPMSVEALQARDYLVDETMPPGDVERLHFLDQVLMEEALRGEPTIIMADVLADHPDQPLERWWWHLGAIRRGRYPVALLPEHVRAVLAEAGRP